MQGYLHALLLPKTQYMIRSFTKVLSLVLLATATFSACKKDKNDDGLAVTKENLAATYTLASVKYKVTGSSEKDVTSDPNYVEQCTKDDQMILKSDLTYEVKDAGTQCSPSSAETGTWTLTGSKIAIGSDETTIKSLTKSTLVTEDSYTQSGVTLTWTTTFSRK